MAVPGAPGDMLRVQGDLELRTDRNTGVSLIVSGRTTRMGFLAVDSTENISWL